MFPVRVLHRVAAVVAALALAVPAAGGTVPSASGGHEQKCPQMQQSCGHQTLVLTCCCEQDSAPASVPSSPGTSAQSVSGSCTTAVPGHAPAVVPALVTLTQTALRTVSPPHGHRLIDLPVLFSTFLI